MGHLLTIPGMTEDALLNTSTAPTGGGLRPFPCDSKGWTRHHAVVMKCDLKTFATAQGEKSNLSIVVANGEAGGEILIDLDIRNIPPGTTDVEKAQSERLQEIMKAVKILGAHTGGKLDVDKLKAAHGQMVEIIAKHKGFRGAESKARFNADGSAKSAGSPRWNGQERLFHEVQVILKGEVADADFKDLDESKGLPPMPTSAQDAHRFPGTPGPRSGNGPSGDPFVDDLPF